MGIDLLLIVHQVVPCATIVSSASESSACFSRHSNFVFKTIRSSGGLLTVTTFSYLTERSTIVGLLISLEILWIVADMASAVRKGYHNFESLEYSATTMFYK